MPAGRAVLAALLIASTPVAFPASSARAQALKLPALEFPSTAVVGPWVSYRVRTQTRGRAIRQYTQRVAIVARDRYKGQEGFWVELKTEGLPTGKRIERGFFVAAARAGERDAADEGDETAGAAPSPARSGAFRLARYQVLQSSGKLYEYPPERMTEVRAGGDVGMIELFEFDPAVPPLTESLGPDTLRLGRRVVPATLERLRRAGVDGWPVPGDSARYNRTILIQTLWRNPAVPITGLARSLFQLTTEQVPAAARDSMTMDGAVPPPPPLEAGLPSRTPSADSSAAAPGTTGTPGTTAVPGTTSTPGMTATSGALTGRVDSTGASNAGPAPAVGGLRRPGVVSWTDLVLLDLGSDAVAEVTQTPEPLPAGVSPDGPKVVR